MASDGDVEDEPEWLRGARARLHTMYEADPRLHMGAKMAPAWRFLYDRFDAIRGCVRVADAERLDTHAVRIGRELQDRWIEVVFDRPLASDYTPFPDSDDDDEPRSQASRYQVIRESLVLLSVLVRADYTTWIEELGRACQFSAPRSVNLDAAPLSRKFLFTFDAPSSSSELEWATVQHLLGDKGYDQDFRTEFAEAVQVAASQGVDVARKEPIPIQLRLLARAQWTEAEQIQALRAFADTVAHIQRNEGNYRRTNATEALVPVFSLDSVVLELDNLAFTPAVLRALEDLIQSGVPVQSLTLPVFPLPHEPDWSLSRSAWASLSTVICGHPERSVVRSVSISAVSASSPYLVSFLSALRHCRGLKSVTIGAGREFEEASSLWAWLAVAIFRADASSSVEVLHLDNFELTRDFDQFPIVLAADDPLGCLWGIADGSGGSPDHVGGRVRANTHVVVREGAEVRVHQAPGHPGMVAHVPREWVGQLVIDDPSMPSYGVFLPGYGLCTINRVYVATPSGAVSIGEAGGTLQTPELPRHQLRSLVLDTHSTAALASDVAMQQDDEEEDQDRLLRFFELIGHRLTDLDLSADYLDDTGLEAVLRSCPRLESARLSSMTLESLQLLIQHYDTGGCRISSLEFRYMAIDPVALEAFLRLLVTPGSAVKRTLKKLRLDEMWVANLPDSLTRVLAQVIEDPTSLDHLHVYVNSFDEVRTLTTERLARFHGQAVAPTPLALVNRLALISALRCQSEHSAVMQLNQDMLRHVYAFAGDPTWRVVLIDCHTD